MLSSFLVCAAQANFVPAVADVYDSLVEEEKKQEGNVDKEEVRVG